MEKFVANHGHNNLRLFDSWANFPFTAIFLFIKKNWYIQIATWVSELIKTNYLSISEVRWKIVGTIENLLKKRNLTFAQCPIPH